MRRSIALLALLPVLLTGCATLGLGGGEAPSVSAPGPMDQFRLERLFEDQVDKVDGGAGYLRTQIDGIDVYLLTDPDTDRMQIVVPVPLTENVGVQHLVGMLEANFHHGLDAKYALSDGGIFAVFAHRLSTLSEEDFIAGYRQALELARRFDEVSDSVELGQGKGG